MGGGDLESEQPKRPYLLETLHRGGEGGGTWANIYSLMLIKINKH